MPLFGKFKSFQQGENSNQIEITEIEKIQTTSNETHKNETKSKKKLANPIKLLKKKQIEKERENIALNALAPYKAHQKAIIWNSGRGERIYGYPIAVIPQPNGMYVILYRKRYYDWLDELITTLKSIITGKKEQYRVVHVPESCIDISEELITIYAHSFFIVNSYTEIAIPLGENPKDRLAYILALQESEMYRNAFEKIGYELPNVIDATLNLNPTMRAYIGKETMSDQKKKTSKTKEFAGFDMSFSFDRFLKSLGGYDDERD